MTAETIETKEELLILFGNFQILNRKQPTISREGKVVVDWMRGGKTKRFMAWKKKEALLRREFNAERRYRASIRDGLFRLRDKMQAMGEKSHLESHQPTLPMESYSQGKLQGEQETAALFAQFLTDVIDKCGLDLEKRERWTGPEKRGEK